MLSFLTLLVAISVANAFSTTSSKGSSVSLKMMADKSKSLPFLPQPKNIVGLAGDVGKLSIFLANFFYWYQDSTLSDFLTGSTSNGLEKLS